VPALERAAMASRALTATSTAKCDGWCLTGVVDGGIDEQPEPIVRRTSHRTRPTVSAGIPTQPSRSLGRSMIPRRTGRRSQLVERDVEPAEDPVDRRGRRPSAGREPGQRRSSSASSMAWISLPQWSPRASPSSSLGVEAAARLCARDQSRAGCADCGTIDGRRTMRGAVPSAVTLRNGSSGPGRRPAGPEASAARNSAAIARRPAR
jgi:hypothetical protein